jgi:hypothetical protein
MRSVLLVLAVALALSVALGRNAGVVTRLRVLRALDSIRVSPLPSDSTRT